jgi:hypothetical protein
VTSIVGRKTLFNLRSLVLSPLCFGCILDVDSVVFVRAPCAVFVFACSQGSFLPTRFCPP